MTRKIGGEIGVLGSEILAAKEGLLVAEDLGWRR